MEQSEVTETFKSAETVLIKISDTLMMTPDIDKLADALAKAQGEIKNAKKSSDNAFLKARYADLAEVLDQIKPAFSKYGLSLIQMPGKPGKLTTMILHSSGQRIIETSECALAKTDPQSFGSAVTYLRRYSAAGFAGVAQEDDDGNAQIPGKKGGQNPYKVAKDLQETGEIQPVVFKYDLKAIAEENKEDAEKYLVENDAIWDEDLMIWESAKILPRLKPYLMKQP